MVAAAQGDAVLVGERDDVMGVKVAECETDEAAALARGAYQADAGQAGEFGIGLPGEIAVVALDGVSPEGV